MLKLLNRKSALINYKRTARNKLMDYVCYDLGYGRMGLRLNVAIELFAKSQGLTIVGNKKKWLLDLYLSGKNSIICRGGKLCLRTKKPKKYVSKKEFKSQYDDPRWKVLAKSIKIRDNFTCRICGSHLNLHTHHLKYHGDLWNTPTKYLITLCKKCHKIVHELKLPILMD